MKTYIMGFDMKNIDMKAHSMGFRSIYFHIKAHIVGFNMAIYLHENPYYGLSYENLLT